MTMIYTKQYIDIPLQKKRHFGLDHSQAFELELSALKCVKGYPHMCQIVDHNKDTFTLHLKWAGHNLNHCSDQMHRYRKQKKRNEKQGLPASEKPDNFDFQLSRLELHQQVESVYNVFQNLNIVHFDLGPWNFCLADHLITVIDFGCVVLNGNVQFKCLEEPYKQFLSSGGWDAQKQHTLYRLDSKLYPVLDKF